MCAIVYVWFYKRVLLSMPPKPLATQCLLNLTCPEHVETQHPPDCSHSHVELPNGSVAAVPWVFVFNIWLWHRFWARQIKQTLRGECFGSHRKQHVRIKHTLNNGTQMEHSSSLCFISMYMFRCAPDMSHSNILKFKMAVAAVPWVSVFKMCLWLVFWACKVRQQRFESRF